MAAALQQVVTAVKYVRVFTMRLATMLETNVFYAMRGFLWSLCGRLAANSL